MELFELLGGLLLLLEEGETELALHLGVLLLPFVGHLAHISYPVEHFLEVDLVVRGELLRCVFILGHSDLPSPFGSS